MKFAAQRADFLPPAPLQRQLEAVVPYSSRKPWPLAKTTHGAQSTVSLAGFTSIMALLFLVLSL